MTSMPRGQWWPTFCMDVIETGKMKVTCCRAAWAKGYDAMCEAQATIKLPHENYCSHPHQAGQRQP